jgi:PleD family two-component response regulator
MAFIIKDIPHAKAWLAANEVCKTLSDHQLLYVMGSSTQQCDAVAGIVNTSMSYRVANNFAQDVEAFTMAKAEGRRVECKRYLGIAYEQLLLETHTTTIKATNKLEDLSL